MSLFPPDVFTPAEEVKKWLKDIFKKVNDNNIDSTISNLDAAIYVFGKALEHDRELRHLEIQKVLYITSMLSDGRLFTTYLNGFMLHRQGPILLDVLDRFRLRIWDNNKLKQLYKELKEIPTDIKKYLDKALEIYLNNYAWDLQLLITGEQSSFGRLVRKLGYLKILDNLEVEWDSSIDEVEVLVPYEIPYISIEHIQRDKERLIKYLSRQTDNPIKL